MVCVLPVFVRRWPLYGSSINIFCCCWYQTQKFAYPNQISSVAIDVRLSRTRTHLHCTTNIWNRCKISIILIFYSEISFPLSQLGIIFRTQVKKKKKQKQYINQLPVVMEKKFKSFVAGFYLCNRSIPISVKPKHFPPNSTLYVFKKIPVTLQFGHMMHRSVAVNQWTIDKDWCILVGKLSNT